MGSWSWQSHLRPQTGHLSRSLLCGLTLTTIASPSIATHNTTVFTSPSTQRRIFAMRPPSVVPDTFGEVESYGKRAPDGPARGRLSRNYLFSTLELGKGPYGHPHKLPKSQILRKYPCIGNSFRDAYMFQCFSFVRIAVGQGVRKF